MVLVLLPLFLMAVYEKSGLPMKKNVRNIVRVLFIRSKQRSYRTNNYYAVLARQSQLDKEVLRNQLAKGNNGLIKTKYLTFGIEADGLKAAKPRLEHILPVIPCLK